MGHKVFDCVVDRCNFIMSQISWKADKDHQDEFTNYAAQ